MNQLAGEGVHPVMVILSDVRIGCHCSRMCRRPTLFGLLAMFTFLPTQEGLALRVHQFEENSGFFRQGPVVMLGQMFTEPFDFRILESFDRSA